MAPGPAGWEVSLRPVGALSLEVAAAGPRDGPLVVLLHGFPDVWQTWRNQLLPMVNAGFRVLAPNQRGYGKSDRPRGISAYDLDLLASDVVALAESEGYPTFRVVGHDWGGIVAWWVAGTFPQSVERLAILNAPHPGAAKRYLFRHPSQMLRSWYAAAFQLPWIPEVILSLRHYELLFRAIAATTRPGIFDATDRSILREAWSQPGALTAMLNYYRALARRPLRSLQLPIAPPTLVLFGRNDPIEEPGLIETSLPYCDVGRIVWLDEARHWIHREESDRVNAALLRFLGGMDERVPRPSQLDSGVA